MVTGTQAAALIALAAGGAYLATHHEEGYVPSGTPPPTPKPPTGTNTVKAGVSRYRLANPTSISVALRSVYATPAEKVGNGGSVNQLPKEIEEQIKKDLKAQWDAASGAAKVEICNRLKSQFPKDQKVQAMSCDPNMTFQTLLNIAGAAAGTALCGPPCGAVGIVIAAYAGPTIQSYAERAWNDVKGLGSNIADYLPWNW